MLKPVLQNVSTKINAQLEIKREFKTFLQSYFTSSEGEIVKVDFAVDTPFRFAPKVFNADISFNIDNALDISVNKMSALFDRHQEKDFVDIYFIHKELFQFDFILEKAREKHIGLDNYWLSQSLFYINSVSLLPQMIKPVTIDELRTFYNEKINQLMKNIT